MSHRPDRERSLIAPPRVPEDIGTSLETLRDLAADPEHAVKAYAAIKECLFTNGSEYRVSPADAVLVLCELLADATLQAMLETHPGGLSCGPGCADPTVNALREQVLAVEERLLEDPALPECGPVQLAALVSLGLRGSTRAAKAAKRRREGQSRLH